MLFLGPDSGRHTPIRRLLWTQWSRDGREQGLSRGERDPRRREVHMPGGQTADRPRPPGPGGEARSVATGKTSLLQGLPGPLEASSWASVILGHLPLPPPVCHPSGNSTCCGGAGKWPAPPAGCSLGVVPLSHIAWRISESTRSWLPVCLTVREPERLRAPYAASSSRGATQPGCLAPTWSLQLARPPPRRRWPAVELPPGDP